MNEGALSGRARACAAGRRSPRRRSSPATSCSPSTSARGCTSATCPRPARSRSSAGPRPAACRSPPRSPRTTCCSTERARRRRTTRCSRSTRRCARVDDVRALREALADGTIDTVATDHAPHAVEDKDCEWAAAAFGMVGLETALSVVRRVDGRDRAARLGRGRRPDVRAPGPDRPGRRPGRAARGGRARQPRPGRPGRALGRRPRAIGLAQPQHALPRPRAARRGSSPRSSRGGPPSSTAPWPADEPGPGGRPGVARGPGLARDHPARGAPRLHRRDGRRDRRCLLADVARLARPRAPPGRPARADAPPADLGAPLAGPIDGRYLASTVGRRLARPDRRPRPRLDRRRRRCRCTPRACSFALPGADDLFVPADAIRGARLDRGIAGSVVRAGRHRRGHLGARRPPAGHRVPGLARRRHHDELVAAIESLVPTAAPLDNEEAGT